MDSGDRVWRERGLRDGVLAGDERAWRTLYDESYAGLYAYVLWRCGGLRDHADEVVQETWLTAVRRVGRFDPARGSFHAWLRGVSANLLRNYFRRNLRRERGRLPLSEETPSDQDAGCNRRERAERVGRVLSALPERYETVLRAKYLENQSVADIAAAGGETPKAVESLLTRARQAFRDAYAEEDDRHV